jgi:hypothetical protein
MKKNFTDYKIRRIASINSGDDDEKRERDSFLNCLEGKL